MQDWEEHSRVDHAHLHLAIICGKVSAVIGKEDTDYQGLGSRWLTQDKPWLTFVVTHDESSCDKFIHDTYFFRSLLTEDMTEVVEIDKKNSPLPNVFSRTLNNCNQTKS